MIVSVPDHCLSFCFGFLLMLIFIINYLKITSATKPITYLHFHRPLVDNFIKILSYLVNQQSRPCSASTNSHVIQTLKQLKKTLVLHIRDGNPKTALARSCKQFTEKSLGLLAKLYSD